MPYQHGNYTNELTGPAKADRKITMLGMGGWVVPPTEERIAFRKEHGRFYAPLVTPASKYTAPKARPEQAYGGQRDQTDAGMKPLARGAAMPLWMQLADPVLQDVYWMAWNVICGKVFKGLRPGAGFGVPRDEEHNPNEELTLPPRNQFESPSPAAIFHTANWRGH